MPINFLGSVGPKEESERSSVMKRNIQPETRELAMRLARNLQVRQERDPNVFFARVPPIYEHLKHVPGSHTEFVEPPRPQLERYFPMPKDRIRLEFATLPFPHNEIKAIELPDLKLEKMQRESTKRREAYPRTGTFVLRQGDIPDIMNPYYDEYSKSPFATCEKPPLSNIPTIADGILTQAEPNFLPALRSSSTSHLSDTKPAARPLPLPSMLQKPMRKEEYIEKVNAAGQKRAAKLGRRILSKSDSLSSISLDPIYFQHVLQPDFSDFEQKLMIQRPVVIYMQQKPVKNPLKSYSKKQTFTSRREL